MLICEMFLLFIRVSVAALLLNASLIQFIYQPLAAKAAKHLLIVDGSTYLDGYCDFQFEGGNGSLKRLWN